jgi:hypothetical protein
MLVLPIMNEEIRDPILLTLILLYYQEHICTLLLSHGWGTNWMQRPDEENSSYGRDDSDCATVGMHYI